MTLIMRRGVLVLSVSVAALVVAAACGGGAPIATPAPTATPSPTATPQATATLGPTAVPKPTATPVPQATPSPVPTTTGPEPRYGGVLQARITGDSPSWDTYTAQGSSSHIWIQNLLSNLIRYQKDSLYKIEGDAAETWQVSPDGKTITFRLRQDIKWNDGKLFTAADVLYNFRRAGDPQSAFNRGRVEPIASMETPDDSTFRVTLKRVSASFLANTAIAYMLMYPAHVTDMAQWQRAPVVTGAFKLQAYNKGTSYIFTKNPGYQGKDAAGRSLPYLDGITYTVIADPAFALAAFRAGRLHCACASDSDWLSDNIEELNRDIPGAKLELLFATPHELQFNVQKPPFSTLAFRQGVAIGLDKAKIAATWQRGKTYFPGPPLFPPELGGQWGLPKEEMVRTPGYNPDHSVDVNLARGKFQESGIDPRSVELELLLTAFYGPQGLGDLLGTVLSELGLKVKPLVLSTPDLAQRRTDGAFAIQHLTVGAAFDDPGDQFTQTVLTGGTLNFGKYTNPRVDQLLVAQDAELDPVKRRAILWEVQRISLTEFPMIVLYNNGRSAGARPEVHGFQIPPFPVHSAYRLHEVWLDQ